MVPTTPDELKFHDRIPDHDEIKKGVTIRRPSTRTSQKEYKNGMVNVVLF